MTPIIGFLFVPVIFGLFALLLGLVATAFWIWMLVDCATNETGDNGSKVVWILIILFTHFLGALLYFLFRKQSRV